MKRKLHKKKIFYYVIQKRPPNLKSKQRINNLAQDVPQTRRGKKMKAGRARADVANNMAQSGSMVGL